MNTPNKLTLVRIALIPVFLAVLYMGFPGSNYAALAIFILASATDFADGYLARHRGQITDFGKFLDPLADKVLVFAAMMWFVEMGVIPAWAALIVAIREFAVTALRLIALDNGRVIAAARSGKIKTASTMLCLTVLFFSVPGWTVHLCVAVIIVTTTVSGVEYFIKNKDTLNWAK
ncbi:MAG: CDP-diacylglycerol--glycerol-3-phosphate 3-phosphatidyltransferase [Oscillospiraceae bacterium]|nr:CDP-diacylglycerol--glycerol-3-phosphate 3-phosphatidyltransferase [Oscillospiraceae bacterium]